LFWAHVGQQVHRLRTSESSPMLGGSGTQFRFVCGVEFLAARCCWAASQKQDDLGLVWLAV
jgi:hypothetical protein